MKDQLAILVEAVRAAQDVLNNGQWRSSVDTEVLRGILCSAKVDRAMRTLSYEESPPTASEEPIPFIKRVPTA